MGFADHGHSVGDPCLYLVGKLVGHQTGNRFLGTDRSRGRSGARFLAFAGHHQGDTTETDSAKKRYTIVTDADPANQNSLRRPPRLWAACTALTGVTLVALPIFGWVGYSASGIVGVWAAAAAAGVCWFGATIALVLVGVSQVAKQAVSRVLAGMVFRMGLPLVVGLILDRRGGPLSEAHVFGMMVAFYLLTLVVETWLALRLVAPAAKRSPVTEAS